MIILEVKGDRGAEFSGDCSLQRGRGPEKRYRISGRVPAKYWLPAGVVRCSLEKANLNSRLLAILSKDGEVLLRQKGAPPLRWISVFSGSDKAKARGAASGARPLWQ
ncbi:MAG: hypothetical protein EP348_10880 [Alphaproteobacteria bacterium]|nr:MAG: hypothetical protein EP348_10880 [Alphaproteobacteria bacterium]